MSQTLEVRSPYDQSVVGEVPLGGDAEVESALSTAHALFLDRSKWIPPYERIEILERLAQLMAENEDQLVQTALKEGGKPYNDTVVEVKRAIDGVKLGAHSVREIHGEEVPLGLTRASVGRIAHTFREPIGVVVSLSAFNHPLNLIIHQTVPAIAAGCPVVVKPAETTPLSCVEFVKLFHEAGLPPDWCQTIVCERESAEKLATDSRLNFLSFIGSARVGWYLRSKLTPGARCALEHGGAAPVIVDDTVDLDTIIPPLVKGGFYHAGQVCVSVQRVYVPNGILQDFTQKLTDAVSKLEVGDPASQSTEVGPLILPREVTRVHEWVSEAKEQGVEMTCGGEPLSETCYKPTVLVNPSAESKVSSQEIFGPVVCVYGYDDRQEAIDRANSLPYAFQSSVFTHNLDTALDTVQKLNSTAVMVNDHTAFRVDWMPFGGRDASGLGLGGIPHSVHDMTREKMMVIKSEVIK